MHPNCFPHWYRHSCWFQFSAPYYELNWRKKFKNHFLNRFYLILLSFRLLKVHIKVFIFIYELFWIWIWKKNSRFQIFIVHFWASIFYSPFLKTKQLHLLTTFILHCSNFKKKIVLRKNSLISWFIKWWKNLKH